MNQEQRQDDRPRVASFLIDDILAPQALPTVTQCTSPQSALQSSSRHISTEVTDNTLICSHPLNAGCLACYGTVFMVYIHYYYYYQLRTCYDKFTTRCSRIQKCIEYTEHAQNYLVMFKTFGNDSDLTHAVKSGSFLVMV